MNHTSLNDPFDETGEHYTSLNEHHQMGRAKEVNMSDLTSHLILYHGVSTNGVETRAELGRLHALTHAVIGNEDLRKLLNLPERFGRG